MQHSIRHRTMAEKKKPKYIASRRPKGGTSLGREYTNSKTWVYFSAEEREVINAAAENERKSVSGFIADAALEHAHSVLRIANRAKLLRESDDDPKGTRRR